MKYKHVELIWDIEAVMRIQVETLMKQDFKNYLRKWQEQDKCVQREGKYLEKVC